jgi:membrane-associated HD superfamily phosphohydrolase
MNTFGNIKTRLEEATAQTYKTEKFEVLMTVFNKLVLENKDLAELYYIYDDLSTCKGLDRDIADDYINENIEYSKYLIKDNTQTINLLDSFLNKIVESDKNNYKNIDNLIYQNSIRNLEQVLESKKQIKNTLIKEQTENNTKSEVINMPISTMVKVYEDSLKEKLNLKENDLKEILSITNISNEDLEKEMSELKESISNKLKGSLNESTDTDLQNTINQTIKKVMDSKCNHYDYYKLKQLNLGL